MICQKKCLCAAGFCTILQKVVNAKNIGAWKVLIRKLGLDGSNFGIHESIMAQGVAFERGLRSISSLQRVLAPPLLKLARAISSQHSVSTLAASTSDTVNFRKLILVEWAHGLTHLLTGWDQSPNSENQDSVEIVQLLRPAKRSEMVEALLEAKLPEVCAFLLLFSVCARVCEHTHHFTNTCSPGCTPRILTRFGIEQRTVVEQS